jgi:hypothetical protein
MGGKGENDREHNDHAGSASAGRAEEMGEEGGELRQSIAAFFHVVDKPTAKLVDRQIYSELYLREAEYWLSTNRTESIELPELTTTSSRNSGACLFAVAATAIAKLAHSAIRRIRTER